MVLLFFAVLIQQYWIHELDSRSIDAREQAMSELISLGPSVLPALKAIESSDPELEYRIDLIVRTVEKPHRYGMGLPGTRMTFCADGETFVVFGNGILLTPTRLAHSFGILSQLFQRAMDLDVLDIISVCGGIDLGEETYLWKDDPFWSIVYDSGTGPTRSWSGWGSRPDWVDELFRRLLDVLRALSK